MELIQTTMAPALWINYISYGRAHLLWAKLESDFGQVGGASTYFQMVNMVKLEFTDLTELLLQIQQFLELIITGSHQMATVEFLMIWPH